jgi:hypothetical protein
VATTAAGEPKLRATGDARGIKAPRRRPAATGNPSSRCGAGGSLPGGTASRLARRVGLRGDAALLQGLKCDLRLGIAGRPSSMARCREKHDRRGSDGRHPGLAGSDVDLGQPSTAEHGWRQGLVWEASDGGRTGAALPAYTRMGRRRHASAWGRGRVRDPPVGTRGHGSAGRTGEPRCP